MIAAGYLFKTIAKKPDWLESDGVEDIYSVSNCISDCFADYINFWQHNGYWLFNTSEEMETIAERESIDLSGMALFYYEVHDTEFDAEAKQWQPYTSDISFDTKVQTPSQKRFTGYDVVTFSMRNMPECSPLSCNNLAHKTIVNRHCLFDQFQQAVDALEAGFFDKSEPGPFRIFAVYEVVV